MVAWRYEALKLQVRRAPVWPIGLRRLLIVAAGVAVLAGPAAQQAAEASSLSRGTRDGKEDRQPATRPSRGARGAKEQQGPAPGADKVAEAVKNLIAEAEPYFVKNEAAATLRDKSNYFSPADAEKVSQQAVLDLLNNNRVHGNPAVAAYVKWQVLSAVNGKFAEENVKRAIQAYHQAPPFRSRTIGNKDAQQLEQLLQGKTEANVDQINTEWNKMVEPANMVNDVIGRYRTDLFARLPNTVETLQAALEDAVERANAGVDPKQHMILVLGNIRAWGVSGANKNDIARMVSVLTELRSFQGPKVYRGVKAKYDKAGKFTKLEWETYQTRVNPNFKQDKPAEDAVMSCIKDLQDAGSGGGLKLK